jgi:hypothetical protein
MRKRRGRLDEEGPAIKQRLPLALSTVALVVALFGSAPLVRAAHVIASVVPIANDAKNAGAVSGIRASKVATPGSWYRSGETASFSHLSATSGRRVPGAAGAAGHAGPGGPAGATRPTGAIGPPEPPAPRSTQTCCPLIGDRRAVGGHAG